MDDITICNLALSRIGAHSIQALSELSKEATECNLLYEPTRDAVLEDHAWSFATVPGEVLALLSETHTGWNYSYQWPTGCLKPLLILDATGTNTGTSYDIDNDRYIPVGKVEFEVSLNAAKNGKIILSNKEDAELKYVSRVTDPNLFDSVFVKALSYALASELAQSVRGDSKMKQALRQEYLFFIEGAKANNANANVNNINEVNTFLNARN